MFSSFNFVEDHLGEVLGWVLGAGASHDLDSNAKRVEAMADAAARFGLAASRFGLEETARVAAIVTLTVVLFAAAATRRRGGSKDKAPPGRAPFGKPQLPVTATGLARQSRSLSSSGIPICSADTKAISVEEDRLQWFAGEVARIYEVQIEDSERLAYVPPAALQQKVLKAMQEMRAKLAEDSLANLQARTYHEPMDDVMIARLLIARDFDVPKSLAVAEEYLNFRRGLGGIVTPTKVFRTCSWQVPCVDRLGRPVLYIRVCNMDRSMTVDSIRQLFRAQMDAISAYQLRHRTGEPSKTNPLEQYVLLLDAENVGLNDVSLDWLKMLLQESNLYYPDRLQQLYILGVSFAVRSMWRAASSLMHPRTQKKVKMIARENVPQTLVELVGYETLPQSLGGGAPGMVPPREAKDLASQAGVVSYETWKYLGVSGESESEAPSPTPRPEDERDQTPWSPWSPWSATSRSSPLCGLTCWGPRERCEEDN